MQEIFMFYRKFYRSCNRGLRQQNLKNTSAYEHIGIITTYYRIIISVYNMVSFTVTIDVMLMWCWCVCKPVTSEINIE